MSEGKRCREDSFEENKAKKDKVSETKSICSQPAGEGVSPIVAAHYNTLEDKGLDVRNRSRIVYMRNFNNWVKSILINEFVEKYRYIVGESGAITVLDMCCGKGGDLLKWRNNHLKHLVCADLADVSIEQCRSRYNEMKERSARSNYPPIFSAEFLVADCTRIRLKEQFKDPDQLFDLVSCQFSFHYCFESLAQAECMIKNAAEGLKPGGYFIGTIPDANDIVMRQRKAVNSSFGNDVYKIKFSNDVTEEFSLFGAQYDFYLEGVVNCPEFLVHFPTFIELAKKYNLKLVSKERFRDYYERKKETGRGLLGKMRAVETYPPFEGEQLQGSAKEYKHADMYLKEHQNISAIGTISQSEWEVISMYLVFSFVKEGSRSR